MEAALANGKWLAGDEYSLADIGYAPYITRLDHLQLELLWDQRPHIANWYDRLRERRSYRDAFDGWPNESYYDLMKEKGREARDHVKAILSRT